MTRVFLEKSDFHIINGILVQCKCLYGYNKLCTFYLWLFHRVEDWIDREYLTKGTLMTSFESSNFQRRLVKPR